MPHPTRATYSFERYLNVRSASAPSFTPDGQHLSFLTDITGVAEVWRTAVDPTAAVPAWPQQLTFRGERVASATYAPLGETLLITGDTGGDERAQLFTLSPDGAAFHPLTNRPDVIHQFGGWSPDGQRICYATNQRDPRYFDVYERALSDSQPRLLLQHDGTNYAAGYSPDGRYALITRHETNTRNHLLLLDTLTATTPRLLTGELPPTGPARHEAPHWSADGAGLYLLSDLGRQFLSPAYLDLASGAMTYLRADQWDADALALTHDGSRLALVTNQDGYSHLELFDITAGWEQRRPLPTPAPADLGPCVLSELTWSRDGQRLAFTRNAADDAPDVWVWDLPQHTLWRATRSALGGIPRQSFVAPRLVQYPTFDDRQIPAFLFTPPQPDAAAPHDLPVVVYVHGGPESQFRPTFNAVIQYLVSHGYGVLAPNVRGSAGYGYDYQSLDDVRLRMNSVADLRAAAEWLATSGIADQRRIAVMGGSYGGFMTLSALTTYPDLWAAGVDIVGIANFVTFLENTGPWRRKLREAEYGSLEHDRDFLTDISPLRSVGQIAAPLFVVHGANDPRVPVGEAEQIVAALRERDIPVAYQRYEDEGHGLIKRANRLIAYPAIAQFLDTHLRA